MSLPPLTFAPLSSAHSGELLTLRRAAFARQAAGSGSQPHWAIVEDLAQVTADLARADMVHVAAFADGRLVAAVQLTLSAPVAYLDRLAVAPDLQQRGVGIELIRAVPGLLPAGIEQVTVPEGSDEQFAELVGAFMRKLSE